MESTVADPEMLVFDFDSADGTKLWKLGTRTVPPRYPREVMLGGVSACLFVAFVIEPDGTVSRPVILRSMTNAGFQSRGLKAIKLLARSTFESLKSLHFEPGPNNPDRKRGFTGYRIGFSAPGQKVDSMDCNIANLAEFLSARASAGKVPASAVGSDNHSE